MTPLVRVYAPGFVLALPMVTFLPVPAAQALSNPAAPLVAVRERTAPVGIAKSVAVQEVPYIAVALVVVLAAASGAVPDAADQVPHRGPI